MIGQRPDKAEYALSLAAVHLNWSYLRGDANHVQTSLDRLSRAVDGLRAIPRC